MVTTMAAVPKREVFERIIQNITSKFPDVYAALFISPEGFPINSWGVTLERAEEISALLAWVEYASPRWKSSFWSR
jgi:predicted regulator of Ras-like GTPase activity (Roadblock/LC7/MglB family)